MRNASRGRREGGRHLGERREAPKGEEGGREALNGRGTEESSCDGVGGERRERGKGEGGNLLRAR